MHHPRRGNQLERGRRCSARFTIEPTALLSFHDGLWLGWEIRGNTDSPAALWTHYLLYTMENTSSNQRGAVGLLMDGLCTRREAEQGEGRGKREREFVTDVQPFERKLNKYLISKRWAAPREESTEPGPFNKLGTYRCQSLPPPCSFCSPPAAPTLTPLPSPFWTSPSLEVLPSDPLRGRPRLPASSIDCGWCGGPGRDTNAGSLLFSSGERG